MKSRSSYKKKEKQTTSSFLYIERMWNGSLLVGLKSKIKYS